MKKIKSFILFILLVFLFLFRFYQYNLIPLNAQEKTTNPDIEEYPPFVKPLTVPNPQPVTPPVTTPAQWWEMKMMKPTPVTPPKTTQPIYIPQTFNKPTPVTPPNVTPPSGNQGYINFSKPSPVSPPQTTEPQYFPYKFQTPQPVTAPQGKYQIEEWNDFTGGLIVTPYPTKLKNNEALVLENALWNRRGEIYKRPGYSRHSATPTSFNFLQSYEKANGTSYTMGGSDTALYYYTSADSTWNKIASSYGVPGAWDGVTFNDKFVATHKGILPVVWDGSSIIEFPVSYKGFCLSRKDECPSVPNRLTMWLTIPSGYLTEPGEWIGYTLRIKISTQYFWYYIFNSELGTSEDTIYFPSYLTSSYIPDPFVDSIAIFPWLALSEAIDSGVIDTSALLVPGPDDCSGVLRIKARDGVFDGTWDGCLIESDLYKSIIGGSRYIEYCYPASFYYYCSVYPGDNVNYPFVAGSKYRIKRTGFWKPEFVEVFGGRLWFGAASYGDNPIDNLSVIWSSLHNLNSFPVENNFYFEGGGGGITGMISMAGKYVDIPRHELLISKLSSLYKVFPSAGGYDFTTIANDIGCYSNHGMSVSEGRIVILPDQNGIWGYDGVDKPKNISAGKIQREIDSLIDNSSRWRTNGFYNSKDRHYYFSYYSNSAFRTLAWNIDYGGWSRETVINPSAMCFRRSLSTTGDILFANYRSGWNYGVYYYGVQARDGGTTSASDVIFKYQSGYRLLSDDPFGYSRIKRSGLEVKSDSAYAVWVYDQNGTKLFSDTLASTGWDIQQIGVSSSSYAKSYSIYVSSLTSTYFLLSRLWWEYLPFGK